MKKLMIAVAAVAMATAANAVTFNWGVSTALDTEKFGTATAYLLTGSPADLTSWAATATSFDIASVKTALGASDAVLNLNTGSKMSTELAISGGMGTSTGNNVTSAGGANPYNVFAVVISGDGKYLAVAKDPKGATISPAPTPFLATWGASDFNTYSAVPEPTSGLLLLLGVAGLALRRRRA